MILASTTAGTLGTIAIIVLLVVLFGVIVISDDMDWFD